MFDTSPEVNASDERGVVPLRRTRHHVSIRSRAYAQSSASGPHTHGSTQLGVCRTRTLVFRVGPRLWMVPPGTAFYAPAGTVHQIQSNGPFEVDSIFFGQAEPRTPRCPGTIAAKPLLAELVHYLVEAGRDQTRSRPVDEAITLVYDLLDVNSALPILLPMPRDRRLVKIAHGLIDNPTDRRSLEEWAEVVGASARTLSRLFPPETGMTFRDWQQTLRLTEGIRRLMEGTSVVAAAADVGYENAGAFITMFKRATGMTPARYMREIGAGAG